MFTVDVIGIKTTEDILLAVGARSSNMRPALVSVREDMYRAIRQTFMSQGRRYGGSWQSLAEDTIRRKLKKGLDPRILIARGRLMDSLTERSSKYMRTAVTKSSIRLNTTLSYAQTQQFGDEARGIPARPFVNFHPRDWERWRDMVARYLVGV